MIFPFWLQAKHLFRAPVTMMLLGINIFFFLILPLKNGVNLPASLTVKVAQRDFISVHSFLYENYLSEVRPKEYKTWLERFYRQRDNFEGSELDDFWYQLSFRDGVFLKKALTRPPYPDRIRYEQWKKTFAEFEKYQKQDIAGLFGVSINGMQWSHYITYQFVHAGFLHLFSNMMILIFFGVLIEMQVGSWVMLSLFLLGGAAGGLFYSMTTGNNLAPLIGASGSVSTLITFLLFTERRKNLRFFFFFFPSSEYFGDIYLSKWWLVPLLILGDFNAVLTSPDWNLNVAHTAHIGAILFGTAMAVVYRFLVNKSSLAQTLSWVPHVEESFFSSGSTETPLK